MQSDKALNLTAEVSDEVMRSSQVTKGTSTAVPNHKSHIHGGTSAHPEISRATNFYPADVAANSNVRTLMLQEGLVLMPR